jgi:hypothetical protein
MALTIIQNPLILQPCNNPIPIVVSSDDASNIGFRYYLTLNITGTSNSTVSLFIYPDTTNSNYMVYDAAMILSDFIGSTNNWKCSGITISTEDTISFRYTVTEYTLAVSGETYSSDLFYAFRGVKQYGDFWNYNNYICGSSSNDTNKFLTNWDGNKEFKLSEYGTINTFYGIFSGSTCESNWDKCYITAYNLTGETKSITLVPTGLTSIGVVTLPLGPVNINSGSTNFIDSFTSYYTLRLDYSNTIASKTLRVDIDNTPYKFDGVQFLWLGELGTYETYTFRAKDIKNYSIERNESRKNYWGFNSTYHYSIGDRGRSIVNLKATEEHTVYSGWIDTITSQNLMELYLSPEVFIIKNGNIYPIIITNKDIEEKTKLNNEGKIFFHIISYTNAYEKMSNL